MNEDEFTIIKLIQQGDTRSYKQLVSKYQWPVFNLMFNMTHNRTFAEELTQDVFVRAYENLHSFDFNHRFFSWLYRIAINLAISQNNRMKRYDDTGHFPDLSLNSVEEKLIGNERLLMLHDAIAKLNEKHRPVIVLYYFDQLTYAEISELLNITEKKVKSRLFEARKKLKKILGKSNYF